MRYLALWRQEVEDAERRHRVATYRDDCPCCQWQFTEDSRARLEALIRRKGKHAHTLRAEVHRLDERFRAVTVERGAWASAPWWLRREPWD